MQKRCVRSQAVPFLGPCSGSFFEVCCIKVAEAQRFGFKAAPRLREALLSEAGFEKGFRIQNWVRRSKLLQILFLVGASGVHIGCCLNPVEGSFLLFRFVWWLDCLLLNEAHQPFAALGHCLKCFLLLRSLWVFAQVVGFHLNDCIEYFNAPCWPPLPL